MARLSSLPAIREVERIVLDVPFTPRCEEWNALLVRNWRVVEICRVLTEDPEVWGIGETVMHYTWQPVTDGSVERVVGRNPAELLFDDSLGAGLQMAMFDLVGKALGVPAHSLMGHSRVREWVPIAWWNTKMPPEALAEEAR
ncbi:MAG: enolase, partial [Armatimonadaceae bacterium]